jgi:hypothetical protein
LIRYVQRIEVLQEHERITNNKTDHDNHSTTTTR